MGYIQGDDRRQQFLLPPSIDEYVDESSPVRVLDAFVDGLDLEALSFTRSTPASTGRPGYDPRDLLKLYKELHAKEGSGVTTLSLNDIISDGFGNEWSKKCSECGKMSMVVVRPGKVQCNNCG